MKSKSFPRLINKIEKSDWRKAARKANHSKVSLSQKDEEFSISKEGGKNNLFKWKKWNGTWFAVEALEEGIAELKEGVRQRRLARHGQVEQMGRFLS